MSALRDRLRSLPSFPDALPSFSVDEVPTDPIELFLRWLDDAIETGERQPHAMTFTTVDDAGRPSSRTLIVKDVDGRGVQVASSAASRKGAHLATRLTAGMLFFWRALGRQVELTGRMVDLGPDAAAADWAARPEYAGTANPEWRVWALEPDRVEFLQARHDRQHLRVEYRLSDGRWSHRVLGAS